jgi:hypothetical protein
MLLDALQQNVRRWADFSIVVYHASRSHRPIHPQEIHMSAIDSLRVRLGLTDAPRVRAGLAVADEFFRNTLHQDPAAWIGYLRGIDFHQAVSAEWLPPGTRLIRYESTGTRTLKPFLYFTRRGTAPNSLGTSFASVEYKEFEVNRSIRALVSTASGINFAPDDRVSRPGGGLQYVVAFVDAPALVRTGSRR